MVESLKKINKLLLIHQTIFLPNKLIEEPKEDPETMIIEEMVRNPEEIMISQEEISISQEGISISHEEISISHEETTISQEEKETDPENSKIEKIKANSKEKIEMMENPEPNGLKLVLFSPEMNN